jgi:hypothetical protein
MKTEQSKNAKASEIEKKIKITRGRRHKNEKKKSKRTFKLSKHETSARKRAFKTTQPLISTQKGSQRVSPWAIPKKQTPRSKRLGRKKEYNGAEDTEPRKGRTCTTHAHKNPIFKNNLTNQQRN